MAGEVTIVGDIIPDVGGSTGDYRLLWGTVVLDGTNPTPVTLTNYVQSIDFGVANIVATASPGDDPIVVCVSTSAAVLNIEAYKTDGSDPTLVDSTNNTVSIAWFAIGPKKGK